MSESKNCVIYARISSKNQKNGHSIDTQINLCLNFANNNDLNVINNYHDIGSGTKLNNLLNLNKLIDENSNCLMLVTNVDRFSRNVIQGISYLDLLKTKNIIIYALDQSVSSKNIFSQKDFIKYLADAEFESKQIGERIKKSINNIKNKGGAIGKARFGYEKKKINNIPIKIKNKKEQLIIKLIVDLRRGNKSCKKINDLVYKIVKKDNKPIKFYDDGQEIEYFDKYFTLSYNEISEILNDCKITIRDNKCNKTNIANIYKNNTNRSDDIKLKYLNKNITSLNLKLDNLRI